MSDLASRIVGSGHRVTNGLRSLWPSRSLEGSPSGKHATGRARGPPVRLLRKADGDRHRFRRGFSGSYPGHATSITAHTPSGSSSWVTSRTDCGTILMAKRSSLALSFLTWPWCPRRSWSRLRPISAPNGRSRPGCAARNFSTFSCSSPRPPSPTRQDVSSGQGCRSSSSGRSGSSRSTPSRTRCGSMTLPPKGH